MTLTRHLESRSLRIHLHTHLRLRCLWLHRCRQKPQRRHAHRSSHYRRCQRLRPRRRLCQHKRFWRLRQPRSHLRRLCQQQPYLAPLHHLKRKARFLRPPLEPSH